MATPRKGLGKGLSALISENYVQPAATAKEKKAAAPASAAPSEGNIQTLPVARLRSGKYQPRKRFDEGSLKELTESIEKNGIMQPLVVRVSEEHAEFYEIIAGERRWRAARMAQLTEVPVIIRDITDQQALELALIENIQRQDLSPLEEATGFQRLIDEFGYTQEKISASIGKSRSHITNLLRLLALPEEVKAMLDKGEISMGHARALLTAPNPVELARDIVKKGLNVRQVEQFSKGAGTHARKDPPAARPASYKPSGAKDPDILALEESLSENLGIRVSINDRGQSGEIILSYDSLQQLDEILRRLGNNPGL